MSVSGMLLCCAQAEHYQGVGTRGHHVHTLLTLGLQVVPGFGAHLSALRAGRRALIGLHYATYVLPWPCARLGHRLALDSFQVHEGPQLPLWTSGTPRPSLSRSLRQQLVRCHRDQGPNAAAGLKKASPCHAYAHAQTLLFLCN